MVVFNCFLLELHRFHPNTPYCSQLFPFFFLLPSDKDRSLSSNTKASNMKHMQPKYLVLHTIGRGSYGQALLCRQITNDVISTADNTNDTRVNVTIRSKTGPSINSSNKESNCSLPDNLHHNNPVDAPPDCILQEELVNHQSEFNRAEFSAPSN